MQSSFYYFTNYEKNINNKENVQYETNTHIYKLHCPYMIFIYDPLWSRVILINLHFIMLNNGQFD